MPQLTLHVLGILYYRMDLVTMYICRIIRIDYVILSLGNYDNMEVEFGMLFNGAYYTYQQTLVCAPKSRSPTHEYLLYIVILRCVHVWMKLELWRFYFSFSIMIFLHISLSYLGRYRGCMMEKKIHGCGIGYGLMLPR